MRVKQHHREQSLAPKREQVASADRQGRPDSAAWCVVLAGGEGVRLRSLVREISGDARPKQYVPLFDSRTLLQATLDRFAGLAPPERTVVVTMRRRRGAGNPGA
jgi:CTP:molybdopterin cytidylyltransferase MocA